MSNLAAVLKKEISRLARKEIRAASESTRKTQVKLRNEIAQLKKRVMELERCLATQSKDKAVPLVPPAAVEAASAARVSPKSIRTHRKRLGFSAENYAKILGVSMQTVYHWEQGKSRPRQSQLLRLAAVRQMGKREARAQLAIATAADKKSDKKSSKKTTKKKSKKKSTVKKASKTVLTDKPAVKD